VKGWRALKLDEVWKFRDLLWFMTVRDIKGRYQQMALGPLWVVIRPLMGMVMYSLIFGGLARLPSNGLPYPIFAYTALLPWNYCAGIAGATSATLRTNMQLISKVYFPRLVMPLSDALTGFIDFSISFIILIGMMLFYGIAPTIRVVFLPLFLLLGLAYSLGLGLWFAGLNVRFRDTGIFFGYLITAIQWITPIAYSAEVIAERFPLLYPFYKLNPMFWVVEGFRWALLGRGESPDPIMIIPVMLTILLLISGIYIFNRAERTVVDIQ
jgi:lipopolysaccharide transport system permease protein